MKHLFNIKAIIKGYEDAPTPNGDERIRVICSTVAPDVNLESKDITSFLLAESQRTEYSVFIPKRKEGIDYNDMLGKDVVLDIYSCTLSELSGGKVNRVEYTNGSGETRQMMTLTNSYLQGTPTDEPTEFGKMQVRLRNGITSQEFTINNVPEPQPQPQPTQQPQPQPQPKVVAPF